MRNRPTPQAPRQEPMSVVKSSLVPTCRHLPSMTWADLAFLGTRGLRMFFVFSPVSAPASLAVSLPIMRQEKFNMKKHFTTVINSFVIAVLLMAPAVKAADLKPEAVQSWNQYLAMVDERNQAHLAQGHSFLASDQVPGQMTKLRDGQIIVTPVDRHIPLKVDSALIHDWVGAAFIPNATITDLLSTVRNYDRYVEFYQPNVVMSKALQKTEFKDHYSMVMINKSVVAKTALDADYTTTYVAVDEHRWYSISESTRIQEMAEYGTPAQHILPENQGTGLIWRLHTVTRFEEKDGGVYIELEAVALSRDIPSAFRWMVEPIVRRVSRSSMTTSLQETESAVFAGSRIALQERRTCVAANDCVQYKPVPATSYLQSSPDFTLARGN
jgi:hypothetical protein